MFFLVFLAGCDLRQFILSAVSVKSIAAKIPEGLLSSFFEPSLIILNAVLR